MAQADLEVTIKFQKANVYPYVEAMCGLTHEPLLVKGEVTASQMKKLIRQTLNTVQVAQQQNAAQNALNEATAKAQEALKETGYLPPEGENA